MPHNGSDSGDGFPQAFSYGLRHVLLSALLAVVGFVAGFVLTGAVMYFTFPPEGQAQGAILMVPAGLAGAVCLSVLYDQWLRRDAGRSGRSFGSGQDRDP